MSLDFSLTEPRFPRPDYYMAANLGFRQPTGERSGRRLVGPLSPEPAKKKKVSASDAWREARELLWSHRRRLTLGLVLMLISRLAGLVLPASSKWLIDDVVGKHRTELLLPIALAAGAATLVQAVTSFALSQILGVAAQRAITDMRKRVQAHVMHLPVRYFDSTQTGILISRIMSDAEGHPESRRHRLSCSLLAASSRPSSASACSSG